jgi:hypothetical protein
METNVTTDKKARKSKKYEAAAVTAEVQAAAASEAPTEEGGEVTKKAGSTAPRPRKWDYGFLPDGKIVPQADTANVKKDVAAAWEHASDSPTVEEFFKRFTNTTEARHGLRVLSRRGLVKIIHPDGAEYPQAFVAKPKAEKAEETAEAVVS